MPVWWNWQTPGTQNPVSARTCGFDPRHRHQRRTSSFAEVLPFFFSHKGFSALHFAYFHTELHAEKPIFHLKVATPVATNCHAGSSFPPGAFYFSSSVPTGTSGRPAMLVSRLSTPESAAALATIIQLTSPIAAAVPTVATAVCAMVFTARTSSARLLKASIPARAPASPSCRHVRSRYFRSRYSFVIACLSPPWCISYRRPVQCG